MGQILGSIFGIGSGANAAATQFGNAAQTQANNATNIDQLLMQIVQGNQSGFGSSFAPAIGAQGSALLQALSNPTTLNALRGYSSPLSSFFGGEMTHGLDPKFVGNQYSQLQQQGTQSLNDIISRLGPGANPAAAMRDTQNSLLQSSTNLAGNLAGENQQVEQSGAQGLQGLGTALDTTTMNEQQLRDQVMGILQNYINSGLNQQATGMSSLEQLGEQAQQGSQFDTGMGFQYSQMANDQQQQFFNSLVSLGTAFLPGGQFAGLFGGGGAPQFNMAGAMPNTGLGGDYGVDMGGFNPGATLGSMQSPISMVATPGQNNASPFGP